jgi:uncharacterized protein YbdZ (MbtH family)
VRIAVAPDLVGFVESAGLPVVANGLGTQAMLDAYRTSGCVFSATSPGTDHRSCVSIGHIRDFVETVDRPVGLLPFGRGSTHFDRGYGESVSVNAFADDSGSFFVLVNDEEQHGRWPTFPDVPAGWRVAYGEADRTACLDYIEQNWPDIRPKSLRERLAESRGFDK